MAWRSINNILLLLSTTYIAVRVVVLWPQSLYQVSVVGWRISEDTGCAGCRRVERILFDVKNTHTQQGKHISEELFLQINRTVYCVDLTTTQDGLLVIINRMDIQSLWRGLKSELNCTLLTAVRCTSVHREIWSTVWPFFILLGGHAFRVRGNKKARKFRNLKYKMYAGKQKSKKIQKFEIETHVKNLKSGYFLPFFLVTTCYQ